MSEVGKFRRELVASLVESFGALPLMVDVEEVVGGLTRGWQARADRSEDSVRWHLVLPPRPLDAEERAEVDAERAVRAWLAGDGKEAPPPGVSVWDLLAQKRWWVGADAVPVRLGDMSARRRANLLAWFERSAPALREREAMWLSLNAPDDVVADMLARDDAGSDRAALSWLHEQPLVRRLRRMVKADRVLEEDE